MYYLSETGIWHVVDPLPGSPLVVFVNSKSGGGHGDKFLRRFKQILNPGQVFDLSQDGPTFGYVYLIFGALVKKRFYSVKKRSKNYR